MCSTTPHHAPSPRPINKMTTDSDDGQVDYDEEEDDVFAMESDPEDRDEGSAKGKDAPEEAMEDGEITDGRHQRRRIPRISAGDAGGEAGGEAGGDRRAPARAAKVEYEEEDQRQQHRRMSATEAMRLANTFNVSMDVVYAAHERRHDMSEPSLTWVALSLELDVNRGPKEPFSAWKERVATTAHALNTAHPWDHLSRFKSMPHDARWGEHASLCPA